MTRVRKTKEGSLADGPLFTKDITCGSSRLLKISGSNFVVETLAPHQADFFLNIGTRDELVGKLLTRQMFPLILLPWGLRSGNPRP